MITSPFDANRRLVKINFIDFSPVRSANIQGWEDNDWVTLNYSSAERFRKILDLEVRSEDFGIYGE